MPPIPEDNTSRDVATITDERVVISGMSGLYPNSHNVQELADILYNKENPVSSANSRWNYNHPEVAQHTGKVPDLELFDGQFFKVHHRLGNNMDPMGRKVLEQAYQAIYDAGVSPTHLNGKKVGVYIGTCFSEAEKVCFYVASSRTGFGIAGCNKSMFANRISYWLNAKGPSFSIDDACCSSSVALEQAYLDITRGECEAAIVGGSNLCLHPQSSIHYSRIMKLSMDGKTKSFDQHADGCAKSEAICVLFLQKAKDALRIYAEVLNVENKFIGIKEDNIGPRYGTYRDSMTMINFIKNFYERTGIPPSVVEYVDAFGSAVPEADKAELEALAAVFCENRNDPLMVGSMMSNIGYCEAASGIAAITKVLLGYHKGEIAANLNCETPRQDVKALCEGRMRIVTEHEKFRRTYAAVNTISVTGVNCHVLLHGHYKPKDLNRYKSSIPHLVTVSGRQESSVEKIFEELLSQPIDPEQLALLHNVHSTTISGHLGRGFIILGHAENQTVGLCQKADYFDDVKRPLCFVYSGMGSQWSGMGAQLMRIPIFAGAIERCHEVLQPKGIDIIHIITAPDKYIFDNILHSFVGIAAIQIGLTDILKAVGLVPDIIIGHSVGELGCAYGDGCFTAEEMILAAYYRGLVSVQTPFIRGSMAAIGIGYEKIKDLCPPEIEVACHNGPDSCTISGPADVMKLFVEELTAKSIFAREVPCSNIAYHSRYISKAGPALLKYLSEAIKTPKQRSKRWLSTSVPEEKWDKPAAKYSSAEYHTNNLLNPVLFEETSRLIPSNAVMVEIAPHGLLQAILKRSLPATCHHIPLTKRGHADNVCLVLEALGKLYMEGYLLKIDVLYPKVEFPVSTGTPFLSNLVGWAHAEKWSLPLYVSANRTTATACNFIVCINDDEHSYLKGNVVRGKIFYPFAAALVAVWDTLAMWSGKPKKQLSVQFFDVHLYAQPILHDRRQLRIGVTLHRGTGRFEVMDEDSKVATGFIVGKTPIMKKDIVIEHKEDNREIILKSDDVYKLLHEKGCTYDGAFRSIENINESLTEAHIIWNNNWITLIDGLLQLLTLRDHYDGVSQPNMIRKLGINVKEHSCSEFIKTSGKVIMEAHIVPVHNYISCGGVTLETVHFRNIPMKKNAVMMNSLKFIPRFSTDNMDVTSILHVFLQIIAENLNTNLINIVEILYNDKSIVLGGVKEIINDLADKKFSYKQADLISILKEYDHNLSDTDVVLVQNISADKNLRELLYQALDRNTFLINFEETYTSQIQRTKLYHVLSSHTSGKYRLSLIRWKPEDSTTGITTAMVRTHSDLAILSTTRAALVSKNKLVILSTYPLIPGLKELVASWRTDSNRNQVYLIATSNDVASENLNPIPQLDLAFNTVNKMAIYTKVTSYQCVPIFHRSKFELYPNNREKISQHLVLLLPDVDEDEGLNEIWGSEYYVPWNEDPNPKHGVTLKSKQHGDINSVSWMELSESDEAGIPVTVHYAGLNIHDAKRATGVDFNDDDNLNSYGMDFSGITDGYFNEFITNLKHLKELPSTDCNGQAAAALLLTLSGERVMGLVAGGAASSRIRALPEMLWPVPEHWTLEDAATVPLAYVQAFYCLVIKTKLYSEMRILVHGGAGALGQAVISIALACECDVFTTVCNIEKKRFLLRLFPDLKEEQIGYSRSNSFGDMVMSITKGRGCDIVISCVSEELRNNTLNCSGHCGVTIDCSQLPNRDNYFFGMDHLRHDRSYYIVNFPFIFFEENKADLKRIQTLVSEGIALGTVRPLSRILCAPQEAARALRLLATSRHRGRVLLHLQDFNLSAQPRINCSRNQWHVVICQDDVGLQWVERLVDRGARRLQLYTSEASNYVLYKVQLWRQRGVEIKITYEDLSDTKTILSFFNYCTKTSAVEGIYLIAIIPTHDIEQKLVTYLDFLSRKLCQTLKYFAVISTDNLTGEYTCLSRAQGQLPATKVILASCTNKQDLASISWNFDVDIIERALCSPETIMAARPQKIIERSLLTQIANIAEIKIPQENDDTINLQCLGVEGDKIAVISNYLRNMYSICYNNEQITSLSVKRIHDLEDLTTNSDFKDKEMKGMKTFYAHVDPDELLATTDMVFLPTLACGALMRDDEFDVIQKYLCIIPGLEGNYKRFTLMCERLKVHALVLQPGLDNLQETIPHMAERYAMTLLKKAGLKSPFHLMGYECGIIVTLEVAKILEEHGLTGTIYCVGASPEKLQAVVENEVRGYETDAFQEAVAQHVFTLMAGDSAAGMKIDFQKYSTWKEKIEACVLTLLGHVPCSAQYARACIESAFTRIEQIRNYKPKPYPLRSKIILLQASGVYTSETTEIQKYSQEPVVTYNLQAPLSCASEDLRCANVVNRHLEDDIIQAFNEKNLCESYLTNAYTFMSPS